MVVTVAPHRLTGPQIGELVHLLLDAFEIDELAILARTSLDIDIFDEACCKGDPFRVVMFDFIAYINRRNQVEELLSAVCKERPQVGALRAFETGVLTGAPARPPGTPARAIGAAFDAAAEAARENSVLREVMGEWKVQLQVTRAELDRLSRYKNLHDCLHNLQLQLPAVARAAKAFPAEGTAGVELLGNFKVLGKQVQRARESITGLPTQDAEADWVDDFDQTLAAAKEAVRSALAAPVTAAVAALGRLLPESVRINAALVGAARRLCPKAGDSDRKPVGPGLGDLAHTLTTLAERMEVEPPDNPAVIGRLRAGAAGLTELGAKLCGLTDAHDDWQWIDKELAAGERLPPGPPTERVPRWTRVKQRLGRVCPLGAANDPDAEPLDLAGRWEAAVDPVAAENLFLGLQAAARYEFKEVDEQLLDLTELLAETIKPLDDLLQVI